MNLRGWMAVFGVLAMGQPQPGAVTFACVNPCGMSMRRLAAAEPCVAAWRHADARQGMVRTHSLFQETP